MATAVTVSGSKRHPVVLCLALMGFSASPAAAARSRGDAYVLPPVPAGQLRALLDPGPGKLPGGYRFAGARIKQTVIRATYRSSGPKPSITVLLTHPDQAPGQPRRTRRFALRLHTTPTPEGPPLLAVLAAHVRTREGIWRWVRARDAPKAPPRATPAASAWTMKRWTLLYGALLLLLLILGPLANGWYQRRRPPAAAGPAPPEPRAPWDHYDVGALGLVALFLATVVWPMATFPISGDEATNLEPGFWAQWFLGQESAAHPPLFRFLIHLTAGAPEPLWQLRLPTVLCAAGAIWVFWRLARRRTPPALALVVTAALALSGAHWEHAFEQKSLWMWLLLLLLAQSSFERALHGDRRRWAHYAVWSLLAVLTHYLSVAYLAGHFLYLVLRHRQEWRSGLLALSPAALGVLPLSLVVGQGAAGGAITYDPAQSYVLQLLDNAVLKTELLTLVFAALAVRLSRRSESRESGLLPVIVVGFGVTLALAVRTPVWPRYFFPAFPLGLLWLAGHLRWRPMWSHRIGAVLLGVVTLFHLSRGAAVVAQTLTTRPEATLHAAYVRALPPEAGALGPRVVLIHPGWQFPVQHYQRSGQRHLRDTGCRGQRNPFYHLRGDELLVGVNHPRSRIRARLDRLLRELGQLDVLLYRVHNNSSNPAVVRWVRARCEPLAHVRRRGRTDGGTAHRCRVGPPTRANACRAAQRFLQD